MPRGDGTGPSGMGPMTGRGAGFCAGFRVPGYLNSYRDEAWALVVGEATGECYGPPG